MSMDWGATAQASTPPEFANQIEEVVELTGQIEELEAQLKQLKARRHELQTRILPDIMAQMNTSMIETASGIRIKLGEYVSGSIPKDPDKRQRAFALLDAMGGGDLVKVAVQADFAKGARETALELASELEGRGFPVRAEEKVHPQSLYAFVRERLRNGETVPAEELGLTVGTIAKITKGESCQ